MQLATLKPIRTLQPQLPRPFSSCLARAPIGVNSRKRVRVVWTPNPGEQVAFLACPVEWALFGGKLGGGKTDALLADYLGQVDKDGYAGLFIRKSYPELLQAIRRSLVIYPTFGGKYNKSEKLWTFPSGATLRFGFVTCYEDALRYASDEYQWLGIDEATHIPYEAFELLTTRVRGGEARGIQEYIRLSANPNGKHMLWVRELFIDGKTPLDVYTNPDTGISTVFIPAALAPQLKGTKYERRLRVLSAKEYAALAEGDWYAYEGEIFTLVKGVHIWTWEQFNTFYGLPAENRAIPRAWNRYRSYDHGFAHPGACYWYAVPPDHRAIVYRELYTLAKDAQGRFVANEGAKIPPQNVAKVIAEYSEGEEYMASWSGPDLFAQVRQDQAGGVKISSHFAAEGIHFTAWDASAGSRVAGKQALHQRLHYERDAAGAISLWPMLVIIEGTAPHLVRTLPALEYSKQRPELWDKTAEDHAADSVTGFCKMNPLPTFEEPATNRVKGGYLDQLDGDDDDWMVS